MAKQQARPSTVLGLECRKCQGRAFTVFYTRHRLRSVIRSRKCKNCGARMLTKERPIGDE